MIGSSADGGTVTDPVRYVNNIDGTLRLGSGVQRGETTEICRDGPGRFRQSTFAWLRRMKLRMTTGESTAETFGGLSQAALPASS